MRLGIIHWGFPPIGGGVEAHLLTVCPEMVKQGAEVYILTKSVHGMPAEEVVQGIQAIRCEGMSDSKLDEIRKAGGDIYSTAKKMFRDFLDKYNIEAIQAHNLQMDFFDFSRALLDACSERKISAFLFIHNHTFIDCDPEEMKRILRDLPWKKLIPISRFICKDLQKQIPEIPKQRYKVILHGIDLEHFVPRSKEEIEKLKMKYGFHGRRVILHPARIMRWKGIVAAVAAMPRVFKEFPEAKLVLTGRIRVIFKEQKELWQYNRQVDDTIRRLKIGKDVHIGNYHFSEIPELFSLSDVVIYTTIKEEPFGLCPVEAMASGVPAIVTASGGLVESVLDGKTGFIISKDEDKIPIELADRIIQILSNPSLAVKMGKAGRRRAEEKFDKKRMAREMIELCS
jgi:glycosyltransferase involved in cell wall biosynthesis